MAETGGEQLDQTLYIHQRLYDDPSIPAVPLDLHSAAAIGYYECVQDSISSGVDLNTCNKAGWTALMYASYVGHDTVVNLLLDAGADACKGTPSGLTPLMVAAGCGNESVCYFLIQSGAELDSRDDNGLTALAYAIRQGHQTVVQLLLEHEADMELREFENGYTSLMMAAMEGDEIIVDILIACGADFHAKDKNGHTARSLALTNNHVRTVSLIDSAVFLWEGEDGESGYGVEEGEGGDLFSGAKEMETWQESVAVKKAIHVQLGRRSGPRWSLPPQSLAQHLRGSASAPASVLRRKAFRAAMSMPEQDLPPSLSDTTHTLQPLEENEPLVIRDQRLVEFLTELGLDKYIEVFENQEIDFQSLLSFTDEDLKRVGITLMGPRRKLSVALSELRGSSDVSNKDGGGGEGRAPSQSGKRSGRPQLMRQPSTELQRAYERAMETIEQLEAQVSREHELRKTTDSFLLELQQARQRASQCVSSVRDGQADIGTHSKAVRSTHGKLVSELEALRLLSTSSTVSASQLQPITSKMVSQVTRLSMELEALDRAVASSQDAVQTLSFHLKSS